MAGMTFNPPQSARPIRTLNHNHIFMMDWLVANPGRSLKDLAEVMGYDRVWISQVVNSDMFQALYAQRMKEYGEEAFDTREAKIKAGALEAVDCIRQKLAGELVNGHRVPPSEKFIIDAAKTLLPAAGYAAPSVSKPADAQRHLHLHVDNATLERSRERMRARFGTLVEAPAEKDPTESAEIEAEFEMAEDLQLSLFAEVA